MAPPRRLIAVLEDPDHLAVAYRSSKSIAELARQVGVSTTTVQRALKRHGIQALPRNRNRRPPAADVLDDPAWLASQYRNQTGVEIAAELGVSSRTVYAPWSATGFHGGPSRERSSSAGQNSSTAPGSDRL